MVTFKFDSKTHCLLCRMLKSAFLSMVLQVNVDLRLQQEHFVSNQTLLSSCLLSQTLVEVNSHFMPFCN